MSTPPSSFPGPRSDAIAKQAARWLARRDRGLTSAEQDEYLQWLAADPRHAEAVAQHAAAFERMMQLYEWQPGQSSEPNPELFAPARRRWRWQTWGAGLAAAAVMAVCAALWWSARDASRPAVAHKSHLRVNEQRALPDGSLVELKDGSRINVEFSPARRIVRLAGEAHFKVAKDAARPFFVEARGVTVRAVGTAFNVRVAPEAVEVLVTEGTVHVNQLAADATKPSVVDDVPAAGATTLSAGQRAVVNLAAATAPHVSTPSHDEVAATLEWQAPRFQFYETPLAVAVREFNEHNRTQLVLGQLEIGDIPIGGTFRVDNVDGFVRLLELTLEIHAEPRGENEIVLRRTR
jgi:transmembrane sensor